MNRETALSIACYRLRNDELVSVSVRPWRYLYTVIAFLKVTRCRTGSPCRLRRTGVMKRSYLVAAVTRLSRAFWITCSLCSSWPLTPSNTLLQLEETGPAECSYMISHVELIVCRSPMSFTTFENCTVALGKVNTCAVFTAPMLHCLSITSPTAYSCSLIC